MQREIEAGNLILGDYCSPAHAAVFFEITRPKDTTGTIKILTNTKG